MSHTGIPEGARVLVVGSGAREHAIVWKLRQSRLGPKIYAAPGNAGIAADAELLPCAADDVDGLVRLAQENEINLVVVGPEAPLASGLADACLRSGIRVFGPQAAAARVESSKAFAKDLMRQAGIPTAHYAVFADAEAAKAHVREHGAPIVIKADGLAAGKGVVVAATEEEALRAIDEMLVGGRYGESGRQVVIEQFLTGQEVSLMFLVDERTAVPMLPARDHKRVGDGDQGPNTGGMGAFAPVPGFVEDGWTQVVEERIVRPLIAALRGQGITYRGVLYAGLMMTADGPYVIEFNCRFGDPETQVVLPLLETDLLEVLWAVTEDRLDSIDLRWRDEKAVCVVMAAPGYPEAPRTGQRIDLPTRTAGPLFHAGTRLDGEALVAAGGRVLVALGTGDQFALARQVAYRTVDEVHFAGKHYRTDIAAQL